MTIDRMPAPGAVVSSVPTASLRMSGPATLQSHRLKVVHAVAPDRLQACSGSEGGQIPVRPDFWRVDGGVLEMWTASVNAPVVPARPYLNTPSAGLR